MKRTLTVLSALAGLLVLLLSLGAMPASAKQSQGFVGGAGVVTDDWGDEGTMSQTRNIHSGATGLWQTVLYADGAKKSDGKAFGLSDIDGDFGPNTAAATRNWQSRHGVGVDGVVGPQTFGAADGHLRVAGTFNNPDELLVQYVGSVHSYPLGRLNGVYYYTPPSDDGLVRANYVPPCIDNGTCS
jgi:peptidoglycan hydrolase-like protein with peptidoglycan-binding domain